MTEQTAIVVRQENAVAFPVELLESARDYAKASVAPRTRDAYRVAWQGFTSWCDGQGLSPMPAEPQTVAFYLTHRADEGRKAATLALDVAAIARAHRAAGQDSPTTHEAVRNIMAGIRRSNGTAQRQAAPMLPGHLRAVVAALPESLIGIRDRALLLVGFSGALRRSELADLQVEDVRFVEEGLELTIRRSKTDQEGKGMKRGIPYGSSAGCCPVRACKAWLEGAGITSGPLFRSVNRYGKVAEEALTGRSIGRIVKRSAAAAGLDESAFSGHSLRAGLATSAAKAGKSIHQLMAQTGHKSVDVAMRYIREAELFQDNAASGLL